MHMSRVFKVAAVAAISSALAIAQGKGQSGAAKGRGFGGFGLGGPQLERLAELSGVPFTTIYKVKRGETKNPGIETLRQFMPHVQDALAA